MALGEKFAGPSRLWHAEWSEAVLWLMRGQEFRSVCWRVTIDCFVCQDWNLKTSPYKRRVVWSLSVRPVDSWEAELWILWLCALCFLRYEVSMHGRSVCFWSETWQQAQRKKKQKKSGTEGEIHKNIFCAKINKTFELFTRTNIIDVSTLKTEKFGGTSLFPCGF